MQLEGSMAIVLLLCQEEGCFHHPEAPVTYVAFTGHWQKLWRSSALSNVDFEVYPQEVVGLVGDNGAGKST